MRMENLAAKIEALRLCARSIMDIADELAGSLPAEEPPKEAAPTFEEVRHKLILVAQAGFSAEVKALITKHGASRLSDVDPSHYAALLSEAEAIGEVKADG